MSHTRCNQGQMSGTHDEQGFSTYTQDILDIMDYLIDNYGRVPTEEVKEKEAEIRAMMLHLANPMIILYVPTKKLEKLAIATKITYTES